jgi:hypothetical protein
MITGYIQASLLIPTTMNVSSPAVKADLAVSGGLVAFWVRMRVFIITMALLAWSPVMVARFGQKNGNVSSDTDYLECVKEEQPSSSLLI